MVMPTAQPVKEAVMMSDVLTVAVVVIHMIRMLRRCENAIAAMALGADSCEYCGGQGTVFYDPCRGTGYLSEDD
ncbi:Uncharacterized protein ALO94_00188 [Pseudomonas syringae pv. spinaceae]|uniref:Uncharacterized protein n=2 Tax=Pseudomonas syringae TaxID=317 RepID=A0A0Q0AVW7_PSESX|nr:Uncharacterized protein ALO94_00188 [Pseudomonas syringae pv. spinaceae]